MSSAKSSRAGSRLRNEVHLSPAERNIVDLFPFTRARLNDVPYRQTPPLDETHLTPDDLRQQMLSVVFGWDGDIQDLLRDERMSLITWYLGLLLISANKFLSEPPQGGKPERYFTIPMVER